MNTYYIGYIFKDESINSLKTIQSLLQNPSYNLHNINVNKKLYTNFIKLGKITDKLATEFINYLNTIFLAIHQENKVLNCEFTSFELLEKDGNCVFEINYKNNILENKIVPFIKKFGTDHIIETYYKDPVHLNIELMTFNTDNFSQTKSDILNKIYLPRNREFPMKSIDIYKISENDELTLITSYPFN